MRWWNEKYLLFHGASDKKAREKVESGEVEGKGELIAGRK